MIGHHFKMKNIAIKGPPKRLILVYDERNSKIQLEIPHKILCPYIARCVYLEAKIKELYWTACKHV